MIHPHAIAGSASKAAIALTAFICGSVPAYARAVQPEPPGPPSNHHHVGNGHHNRNILTVRSPTHNRGYQHTSNSNAGGLNNVQNALCRHSTVCTVTQKIIIVTPEKPAPPEEPPPIDVPPADTPPPVDRPLPVSAPQDTGLVAPQLKPEPRPRPAPPPAEAPVRGPFLYMGPYGFAMMAPESSAPVGIGAFGVPNGLFS
jgi:hypothetical protein